MEPIFKFKDNNYDDVEDIDVSEPEEGKKAFGLKGLITCVVLLAILIGSIGGYTVYNSTTMKYDTSEMIRQLNDMKGELEVLEEAVSNNEYVLTQIDMDSELIDEYSGGVVSKLLQIDNDISNTKNDITNLLSMLENNDISSGKAYLEIMDKYQELQNSIIALNKELDSTLFDISDAIEILETTSNVNQRDLLESLKIVRGDLTEVNNTFESNVEDKLFALGNNINEIENSLNELYKSNENQYNKITDSIDEGNDRINMIINNSDAAMNDTLKNNQAELTENINNGNMSITNQLEDNKTYLENRISSIGDNINAVLSNNHDELLEKMDLQMTYLENLIKEESGKVFQFVTKGKYEIASTLAKKYSMASATWVINGVNIDTILEDARNNTSTNDEMYEYVAFRISNNDIKDAIDNLPMQITISSSNQPANITYHKHYHTDGNGNRINAESIVSSSCPGGCFSYGVHNHTTSCFTTGMCWEIAWFTDGGENRNGWYAHYLCPAGHRSSNTASTYEGLKSPDTQLCGEPVTITVCNNLPYNEYRASCGYCNGQIMSAEIVWETCDTGIEE